MHNKISWALLFSRTARPKNFGFWINFGRNLPTSCVRAGWVFNLARGQL